MKTFRRIVEFLQYVWAAYLKVFKSTKPPAPDGSQATAEQQDTEAWDASERYRRWLLEQEEKEFWAGESESKGNWKHEEDNE